MKQPPLQEILNDVERLEQKQRAESVRLARCGKTKKVLGLLLANILKDQGKATKKTAQWKQKRYGK